MAFYVVFINGTIEIFGKLDNDSGGIFIKRHDLINRILSGIFYFYGTKISTVEKINISEGRFDIRYKQSKQKPNYEKSTSTRFSFMCT